MPSPSAAPCRSRHGSWPGAPPRSGWPPCSVSRAARAVDLTPASAYHRHLPAAARTAALDDRTWQDLDLDAVVRALAVDPVSVRAEGALRRLDDPRAGHLVDLVFAELPDRPRCWWCVPPLTLGSVALLALALSGAWPAAAL